MILTIREGARRFQERRDAQNNCKICEDDQVEEQFPATCQQSCFESKQNISTSQSQHYFVQIVHKGLKFVARRKHIRIAPVGHSQIAQQFRINSLDYVYTKSISEMQSSDTKDAMTRIFFIIVVHMFRGLPCPPR